MAYNQIAGINVAGVESHGSGALNYLFVVVPPDVLFVLIGVGLRSSRWFWLNCLVFLASMFLRGWMGDLRRCGADHVQKLPHSYFHEEFLPRYGRPRIRGAAPASRY